MLYLHDVADFFAHNHASIRKITLSICIKYSVQNSIEDILQDVYKTIIKRDILNKYDPNHPSATKISTYIYNLIKNIVRAHRKSNEYIIERRKYVPLQGFGEIGNHGHRPDDNFHIDDDIINVEYENIQHRNKLSDVVDGLNMDLTLFEIYLQKRDKFYYLNKRKDKTIQTRGLSLLRVFKLMRKGLSNREIAAKYGVTNMFITTIKTEIKEQLEKFGLYWKETRRSSNRKQFLSNVEVEEYAQSYK